MGKNLNKVQLIGNVTRDVDVKLSPSGTKLAKITVATNEKFKGKDGNWQETSEFHLVTLWSKLAEIAGEYVKKGTKVYIEGRLQTSSWEEKDTGKKKYMTEIIASDLILLDGRPIQETNQAPVEEETSDCPF